MKKDSESSGQRTSRMSSEQTDMMRRRSRPAKKALLRKVPLRPTRQPKIHAVTKSSRLVEDRRQRLIDAAIKILENKGFHNATIRDIGRAAKLTQGTIYNYVRSKEDILFLVCDRIVTDYIQRVGNAYASHKDPASRLAAALHAATDAMVEHRTEIGILFRETHHLSMAWQQTIHGRISEFIRHFETLIAEVATAEGHANYNVPFMANVVTFVPTIFGLRQWALPLADIKNDDLVTQLVDFLIAGIGLASVKKAAQS